MEGVCEVLCDPGNELRRWEGVCEVPCDPGCSLRRWEGVVKSHVIQGMN